MVCRTPQWRELGSKKLILILFYVICDRHKEDMLLGSTYIGNRARLIREVQRMYTPTHLNYNDTRAGSSDLMGMLLISFI